MKRPRIWPLVLYSMIIGAAIGGFSWFFMTAYEYIINLIWQTQGDSILLTYRWFPLVICGVGSIFVGLIHRYFAPVPEPLNEAIAAIRKTGRLEYTHIKEATVAAFTSLIFGGAVGPEAGLTSIIGGACTWLGDKNKAFFKWLHEGKKLNFSAIKEITTIDTRDRALPTDSGNRKKSNDNPEYLKDYFSRRRIIIIPAIIAGLGFYMLCNKLPIHVDPWLYNHFPNAHLPGWREFLILLFLVPVGFVLGYFNLFLERVLVRIEPITEKYKFTSSVIGGLALGAVACFFPYVLFSGQLQMETILDFGVTAGVGFLFMTAFLKIFMTRFILATGWRGGQIFPIIFSGFSLGLGCSVLAANLGLSVDSAWCVAVVCVAAASLAIGQPFLVAPLLLPLFPWQSWPAIAITAVIVFVFLRILKKRKAKNLKGGPAVPQ